MSEHVIMAQGATEQMQSNSWLVLVIGFLTLLFKDIGKWVADWFKYKKEERHEKELQHKQAQVDAAKQKTLSDLLSVNREQVKILAEVKSNQREAHTIGRMRFEELNRKADKSVCKADCPIDERKFKIIPP